MGGTESVILGVVQGLTEFLPISSSGHLILVREVLGLPETGGLAFDAVLHFATALAVVVYFWRDIVRLVVTALASITGHGVEARERMLLISIITATIPAVLLGILLEDIMATLLRNPLLVAGALIVGSLVMLAAETALRLRGTSPEIPHWRHAFFIGLFQSLALVPGMSRSGMAIAGGMFMGLTREYAARFAFLLAAPLLLGAGSKKLIDLATTGGLADSAVPLAIGALCAFVVGLAVVHYLLAFLRTYSLRVFVWYRLALAFAVIILVLA